MKIKYRRSSEYKLWSRTDCSVPVFIKPFIYNAVFNGQIRGSVRIKVSYLYKGDIDQIEFSVSDNYYDITL